MSTQDIVQKLWNLCNVLRDDGITYHQYVTELTYILFLKMINETGTEEKLISAIHDDYAKKLSRYANDHRKEVAQLSDKEIEDLKGALNLYSWEYLAEIGMNREELWREYLGKLAAAGASREPDDPANAPFLEQEQPSCPSHQHHG